MKITNEESTQDNVTLTLNKNSPHIWAGGLDDTALAKWLIAKANAICSQQKHLAELQSSKAKASALEASTELIKSYVNLGLSRQEYDPIRPPSMEAIQFDTELVYTLLRPGSCEPHQAFQVTPVGYSLLPDLSEEQKEYQEKTAYLFVQESSQYE